MPKADGTSTLVNVFKTEQPTPLHACANKVSPAFVSFHEALSTMRRLFSHDMLGSSAISQLEEGGDLNKTMLPVCKQPFLDALTLAPHRSPCGN